MKYFRMSFFTLAAAMLLASCGTKKTETAPKAQAAPVVSVVTAHAEDVDVENTFTSNIEPYAVNNIVSQTAGRIISIPFLSLPVQ